MLQAAPKCAKRKKITHFQKEKNNPPRRATGPRFLYTVLTGKELCLCTGVSGRRASTVRRGEPAREKPSRSSGNRRAPDPRRSPPTAAAELPTGDRRRVQWQRALNARRCRSTPRQRCRPPGGPEGRPRPGGAAPDAATGERPAQGRWRHGHRPSGASVASNARPPSPPAGQPPAGSPGMGAGSCRRWEPAEPFRARRRPEPPLAAAGGSGGRRARRTWGSRAAPRRDPARPRPASPPRGPPGGRLRIGASRRRRGAARGPGPRRLVAAPGVNFRSSGGRREARGRARRGRGSAPR